MGDRLQPFPEIFRILSLNAELDELSLDGSIVQAHQHSAGAKKGEPPDEFSHSRGGASTKIHAVVDSYGYPVYLMISVGQRGSRVLVDRGYDSQELMTTYTTGVGNQRSLPEKVPDMSKSVTGGYIKNAAWWKNCS